MIGLAPLQGEEKTPESLLQKHRWCSPGLKKNIGDAPNPEELEIKEGVLGKWHQIWDLKNVYEQIRLAVVVVVVVVKESSNRESRMCKGPGAGPPIQEWREFYVAGAPWVEEGENRHKAEDMSLGQVIQVCQ